MSDDAEPADGDDSEEDEPDDPWPDEPDEPLIERYAGKFRPDEDELAPDPPDPDEIPADLQRTFWSAAAGVNVGLLAASLGVMLVAFRGQWQLGGALVVVGAAALGWTYYKYRAFRNRDPDDVDTDADDRKG